MSATAPLQPEQIDIVGDCLAIRWSDGRETFHAAQALRRACPCASCAGEPEGLGPRVKPLIRRPLTERSFALDYVARVGAYGLRMVWGDGHDTGIYSFDYIRDLPEDSGVT